MQKPKNDSQAPNLPLILKDFVVDLWDLQEAERMPYHNWPDLLYFGKFKDDTGLCSKLIFTKNSIKVDSFAMKDLEISIYDDRIEVPWMEPPVKMMAADPNIFEMTIALIAHLMLVCSMGWDTTAKTGEYTQKRVKELVNGRRRNLSTIPPKAI